jgi:uncharacterized cupin superfamily protein
VTIRAIKYADQKPERIEKYSPPETLVKGNPRQHSTVYFTDPQNRFKTVFWEGEPGAYRLTFPADKHEFFHLVTGKVRVHSADGSVIDLVAGDTCVLPGGFDGVFEIIEAASKHAVVAEGV